MTASDAAANPALLPFLPMLYVAWADGDLSGEEMRWICHRLDGDCRSLLCRSETAAAGRLRSWGGSTAVGWAGGGDNHNRRRS